MGCAVLRTTFQTALCHKCAADTSMTVSGCSNDVAHGAVIILFRVDDTLILARACSSHFCPPAPKCSSKTGSNVKTPKTLQVESNIG